MSQQPLPGAPETPETPSTDNSHLLHSGRALADITKEITAFLKNLTIGPDETLDRISVILVEYRRAVRKGRE